MLIGKSSSLRQFQTHLNQIHKSCKHTDVIPGILINIFKDLGTFSHLPMFVNGDFIRKMEKNIS